MRVREYGTSGGQVVLVHGGPGAPGYLEPVARELAKSFRVLEPFQRGSGAEPLTVARHVADLYDLLTSRCKDTPPALVGHSWGAMLALAYAAAHPGTVSALVLIGCGTFDPVARAHMNSILEERMTDDLRSRIENLPGEILDPDDRLAVLGELILPLYSHDPVTSKLGLEKCDARAHRESWSDMLELQAEGVYPEAFTAIDTPVLMLHGAADPHPGKMVRDGLARYLPQLEYREWERCGHYPWLERSERAGFFAALRERLDRAAGGDA